MREDLFPNDGWTMSTKAKKLEQAGTIFKQVTTQLYWASQAEDDGRSEDSENHLHLAMQYSEEAQKILNEV